MINVRRQIIIILELSAKLNAEECERAAFCLFCNVRTMPILPASLCVAEDAKDRPNCSMLYNCEDISLWPRIADVVRGRACLHTVLVQWSRVVKRKAACTVGPPYRYFLSQQDRVTSFATGNPWSVGVLQLHRNQIVKLSFTLYA
jgi:hypothetical protein